MKTKAKRHSSRPPVWYRLILTLIAVALLSLSSLIMLGILTTPANVVLNATPECVPVNPLAVGNMVERGAMVERCLEMGR